MPPRYPYECIVAQGYADDGDIHAGIAHLLDPAHPQEHPATQELLSRLLRQLAADPYAALQASYGEWLAAPASRYCSSNNVLPAAAQPPPAAGATST